MTVLKRACKISISAIIRHEQEARGWPIEDWSGKTAEELAEIFGTSVQLWEGLGARGAGLSQEKLSSASG